MATVEQCRQALNDIARRLATDPNAATRVNLDRSLVCHIRDLDTSFRGRLSAGTIVGLVEGDDPAAQIKLSLGSDDLLALVAGRLSFGSAFATGRLSVKASLIDLLRIRKLA